MLKQVQHDREKGDRIRDRFIEGPIRSLQDDKEAGLWVGRRESSRKHDTPLAEDEEQFGGGGNGVHICT